MTRKQATVLDGAVGRPNGLTLTVDGKTLIVDDTIGNTVFAYDVQPDGTVKGKRAFAELRDIPAGKESGAAVAEADLPVICVETRHMRAVLQAQINKTDRNDARGIAQMMRAGLYRPVHVKTLRSQKLRMLLTHRKLLQSKAIGIENDPRATLRNFGLKVGVVGTAKFEARIRELVETCRILPSWSSRC